MHTGDWNQDIRCKKHEKDTLFNQVVLYQGMFYSKKGPGFLRVSFCYGLKVISVVIPQRRSGSGSSTRRRT
jgi:hypothetical protein